MRRTLDEWLELARAADDAGERARCLDAAAAETRQCWEWRAILAVLRDLEPIDRPRLVEVANRTLEAAIPTLEVWGFNDVAWVRHHRLDDPSGAAAALEAGARAFVAGDQELDGRPAAPYLWGLLARGHEACGDEVGARRCVDAGIARARALGSADSLAGLVGALEDRGAHDEAIALLREAEALPSAHHDAWAIANGWSRVDAPEEGKRVLEAASIAATRCGDALRIARAFASHEDHEAALRALARAEPLAADDPAAWYELAESAVDVGAPSETLRAALERAASLAVDDDLRARIAGGFHRWLDDPETAARVGPRGQRPRALRVPRRDFPGLEADPVGLFDRLRAALERPSLEAIAAADYGHDMAKNLAAIRDVCESGLVPRTLEFGLHEVLALTRWSTGARVDHLARALSCVILLYAPLDDDGIDVVPVLIESCLELGGDAPAEALGLLTWLVETERPIDLDEDEDELDGLADLSGLDDGDGLEDPEGEEASRRSDEATETTDPWGPRGADEADEAESIDFLAADPAAAQATEPDAGAESLQSTDSAPSTGYVQSTDSVQSIDSDPSTGSARFAETDDADEGDDDDGPEPAHLLGLALLLAARDPDDPALEAVAAALTHDAWSNPEHLRGCLAQAIRGQLWGDLFDRHLASAADRPPIAAILRVLGRA
ncbi:MAG: hypothetical protein R3B09_06320 [Nannocystaceae bacterium]